MADIKIVLSADATKVEKALAKTLQKVATTFDKAGGKSERAASKSKKSWEDSNKAAFGDGAKRNIKGYIAAIAGVAGAVRAIGAAWDYADRRRAQAAQRARESVDTAGKLAQVSPTTEAYAMNQAKAMQLFKLAGSETLTGAQDIMYELASAGLTSESDVLFSAQAKGVYNMTSIIQSGGKLRKALGKKEVGGLQGITSKGSAAAAPYQSVSAADILSAATIAAGSASRLGLSDEELIALVSSATGRMKSPEAAGTAVDAMLTGFLEQGAPKGMGAERLIRSAMEQTAGKPYGEIKTFVGGKRGMRAFTGFESNDLADYNRTLAAIREGESGGLAGQKIRMAYTDDRFRFARASQKAANRRKAVEIEKLANARNRAEASIDRDEARMIAQGMSGPARWIRRTSRQTFRKFAGDKMSYMLSEDRAEESHQSQEYKKFLRDRDTGVSSSEQQDAAAGGNIDTTQQKPLPVTIEWNNTNVSKDPLVPSQDFKVGKGMFPSVRR